MHIPVTTRIKVTHLVAYMGTMYTPPWIVNGSLPQRVDKGIQLLIYRDFHTRFRQLSPQRSLDDHDAGQLGILRVLRPLPKLNECGSRRSLQRTPRISHSTTIYSSLYQHSPVEATQCRSIMKRTAKFPRTPPRHITRSSYTERAQRQLSTCAFCASSALFCTAQFVEFYKTHLMQVSLWTCGQLQASSVHKMHWNVRLKAAGDAQRRTFEWDFCSSAGEELLRMDWHFYGKR